MVKFIMILMEKNLEASPIKGVVHENQKDNNVYNKLEDFSVYLEDSLYELYARVVSVLSYWRINTFAVILLYLILASTTNP